MAWPISIVRLVRGRIPFGELRAALPATAPANEFTGNRFIFLPYRGEGFLVEDWSTTLEFDLLRPRHTLVVSWDRQAVQPDVQPLIPDARNAGFAYFRKTGVYPINHGLVVKDSLLKANPGLAKELFDAFRAAKKIYMAHLDAGENLSPADETALALKQVVGDPFPFGVSNPKGPNRKALETMIGFAVDQRVIPQKFSVEELFAPGTLDLE